MTRPIMVPIVSRREVMTETGHYFVETLACKHLHYAFPEADSLNAKRRSCHECLRDSNAEVAWLERLKGKKPSKPEAEQCSRCRRRAHWPWKLCKAHLALFRAARSRKRRTL